eukprot:CAMPEP_0171164440 /NCGR_PEP_ID=MMETSP0790-20130122/5670_1 /TAXON_ID=2925 /ORGANISM="Alexandrium catenella, Strain OF101" /LENGTH=309 /DNA_ID=CAMNT_0011629197 /DNA_START=64 /DNA_END=994 /DNA_ORIENTATION=+
MVTAAWHQKDVAEWSNPEVLAFLDEVLPGHACTAAFGHTSGRVLCSLTKDDLRRQARDEEAANVIWAELQRQRTAHSHREDVAAHGVEPFSIFVRTPTDFSVELDVLPTDTVAQVKARLAAVEGTPVEQQRLTETAVDARTLASYSVSHGAVLLLVPRLSLSGGQRFAPPPAARSGRSAPTATSGLPRPRVPVVCTDIARPFPMSIEFEGIPEYQAFMLALQRQAGRRDPNALAAAEADTNAPFLEILSADSSHQPVQTRVTFDSEAEVLLIDTVGDILMECTRYRVMLHLKDDQKFATLVTGVHSADR